VVVPEATAFAAPAREPTFGIIPDGKCPQSGMRVRKNYINLSDDEKELFFEAVNKLKKEGTYEAFVHMRGSPTNNVAAHMTAHFGFWHRKFLLEFENALRALPGPAENPHKFSCVTIPYWNWAHDGDVCQMLSQVRPIDDDMKVWDCTSYLGPGHWTNSSIEAPEDKDKWIVEDNLVEKLRNHLEFPVTQDPFVTVRDNGGPGDVTCSTSPFCAVDNDKVATQFGTPACSVKKRISPVEDGWGPITCNINGSIVQRASKGFSSAGGDHAVGCVADNGGLEYESDPNLHSRNPYGGWLTRRIDLSDNFTCLSRATNFTIRRPDTGASGDFNTTTDVVELIASRPKFQPAGFDRRRDHTAEAPCAAAISYGVVRLCPVLFFLSSSSSVKKISPVEAR